jgi:hypothetical protein
MVPQGLRPIHQPPVRGPQGLDEGVEGVVLPPIPVELGVQAVKSVVPLPSLTHQILPPMGKAREDGGQEERKRGRNKGKKHEARRQITNPEDAPCGTSMDPHRFVQRPVELGTMVAELLPQRLLGLSTGEVSRRCVGGLPLLLWARCGAVRSREDRT